jgi:pilus assembly protein CpaB
MTARRRRGALMLSLSLACGGLAASEVKSRSAAALQQVGTPVTVVTVRKDLKPGTELTAKLLATRTVPAKYAPPDALTDEQTAIGLRTAGALSSGAYVTAGALDTQGADPEEARAGPGKGERAIELKVAAAQGIAPGARVDVVVTTQRRTTLALEDVELLALGQADDADPGQEPTVQATLRVTLREAVYLTAAHNFAREVRLLPRSPGDSRRAGALEFEGGAL